MRKTGADQNNLKNIFFFDLKHFFENIKLLKISHFN